jgi:hypothetical protein
MNLNWLKCQGDVWCKLNSVNLDHAHFDFMDGVYIIWHGGPKAHTVRVGQGRIRERLKQHRVDSDIQQYSSLELYVTWAPVAPSNRDGIELYLSKSLKPLVGDRYPDTIPIPVNLPWYAKVTT